MRLTINPEIKRFLLVLCIITPALAVVAFGVNTAAGAFVLITATMLISAFFVFTRWRYRQIANLSSYLKRISQGEYDLDIRDNVEGELSILKSEIYKITVMLREQAEAMQKDKIYLAESLSDISHQLKTPLTSMMVMTDLMQDERMPLEKRLEFNGQIRTLLGRVEWLVSSLLKLSKLNADTVSFKKEKVVVKELVDHAASLLAIAMELKEQVLQIEGDTNVSFTGDMRWSSEAVVNILKNCVEHTPVGGVITVRYEDNPLYTNILISDTGSGIDREDLPYIFNRFYKGKNAHEESVGIGLAMAKSILEKQGGDIAVKSEPNSRTEFCIKIYKGIV